MFKIKYYFTADTHFGHSNIIIYANRPFLREGDLDDKRHWVNQDIACRRVEEMNRTLIKNWNDRVKPEDTVFVAGDFCFKNSAGGKPGEGMIHKAEYYRSQLNGNIIFVKGNHDCFSEDTRLLTCEGYKYYTELRVGDLVPTINLERRVTEYKPIKEVIVNPVSEIFGFKSRTAEGLFSNNHKLLTIGYNQKRDDNLKIEKKTCKELWSRKSFFLLATTCKSSYADQPISDNYIKLLGWIYTDGGISQNRITIYQSKKHFILEIKALLENLNIPFHLTKRNRKIEQICGRKLKSILPQLEFHLSAKESKKVQNMLGLFVKYTIPEWLIFASDRQIKLLINEMVKGNGSITNSGSRVIWGRKEFLDQIMGICVTHGIDCNLVKDIRDNYYLCVHKERRNSSIGIRQIYPKNRFIYQSKEITWCVNVDNHTLFTELNGKPLISGNSNNSVRTIIDRIVIKYGPHYVNITHIPENYDMNFAINFCGHVHDKWCMKRMFNMDRENYTDLINVGVDVWNFRPITFEEIYTRYRMWSKNAPKKLQREELNYVRKSQWSI